MKYDIKMLLERCGKYVKDYTTYNPRFVQIPPHRLNGHKRIVYVITERDYRNLKGMRTPEVEREIMWSSYFAFDLEKKFFIKQRIPFENLLTDVEKVLYG